MKVNKNWYGVLGWLVILGLFLSLNSRFMPMESAAIFAFATSVCLAISYMTNVYWVYPKFHKNLTVYILISLFVILAITSVYMLIEMEYLPHPKRMLKKPRGMTFHFIRLFMMNIVAYLFGTFFVMYRRNRNLEERGKELVKEKLETELKLLKAQIDPHFIFNALNNIYSLTYMKADNAPESVLKLSEMLRYVFYDCSKDKVPLASEYKYIENFSAFQKMKSDHDQNIVCKFSEGIGQVQVAPMLFIPFIENAFKYSRIEEDEDAFVEITLEVNDNRLNFLSVNSIPSNRAQAGSGMGIKNVQHRLGIIYPNKYSLSNSEKQNTYLVALTIDLN
ncbi:sensor histidine kinase [Reichenbachiella versicolor]|uniref:sensor histidine kinase n=1 Tax=Reichenbachiella versicolor TaxID=1821036 RepID=UPI000D6DF50D|nr:sensor histidine kinase [Reichenbachiella versicolor]